MIVEVHQRDGFRTFKSSSNNWFYTKEEVEVGNFIFDWHFGHYGRRWATNIRPKVTDYKKLSKDFRQRVKEFKK